MIEIKDFSQFNELVRNFRKLHNNTLTNCFMMPDEIQRLADEGKLFVAEYPQWLIIICDRNDYRNFYYYTTESSDITYVKSFIGEAECGDLYIDIVSRSGRGDSVTPAKLIEGHLAQKYKSYKRMVISLRERDLSVLKKDLAEGYSFHYDFCDKEAIHALWKTALDEKSTPLPDTEELKQFCENGNLITVLDSKGDLAGVALVDISSKNTLIQHLSVSPDHRRKGLAMSIMSKGIELSGERNVYLWVDRENSSAIAIYDRLKFKDDGTICDQLYMKGN